MEKKYYKQLTGKKMKECLEAEGAKEALSWLAKAAKHGVVPIHHRLQELGDVTPDEFGSKVELKCDETAPEVQLIEDCKHTVEDLWNLPAEVERVLADGRQAVEALSRRHNLHPTVGYQSVPVARRPTYEGSAAQAEAAEEKEAESSGDDENSDTEPVIQNNASRTRPPDESRQEPKRRRAVVVAEPEEDVEEVIHDVLIMFGRGSEGQREMWLTIKVKGG
jgi:hypothetical protein